MKRRREVDTEEKSRMEEEEGREPGEKEGFSVEKFMEWKEEKEEMGIEEEERRIEEEERRIEE